MKCGALPELVLIVDVADEYDAFIGYQLLEHGDSRMQQLSTIQCEVTGDEFIHLKYDVSDL